MYLVFLVAMEAISLFLGAVTIFAPQPRRSGRSPRAGVLERIPAFARISGLSAAASRRRRRRNTGASEVREVNEERGKIAVLSVASPNQTVSEIVCRVQRRRELTVERLPAVRRR